MTVGEGRRNADSGRRTVGSVARSAGEIERSVGAVARNALESDENADHVEESVGRKDRSAGEVEGTAGDIAGTVCHVDLGRGDATITGGPASIAGGSPRVTRDSVIIAAGKAMASDALPAGTRLGAYRIVETLGRGGMGVVYRAEEEPGGRPVALKVIARDLVANPNYMKRFEREARAAAAVSHPNIAALRGSGEQDGVTYLAFELVPGGTLKARLATKGPLEWREAARLGARIASALAAIHEAGFVHRDVKPENVLLDGDGTPKLADFGLARREQADQGGRGSLTKTGEILGTPEYMSPEQADGAPTDARADLYSLGATIHALVAGRPPFEGQGYMLLTQVLTRPPPPLRTIVPSVPEALDRLVLELLAKDPTARPARAAEVAVRLETLAKEGLTISRSRGGVVLVVLGLLVGCGLATLLALRRPAVAPSTAEPPSVPRVPVAPRRRARLVPAHSLVEKDSKSWVTRVRVAAGGKRCVWGSLYGTVYVWDFDRGATLTAFAHTKSSTAVAIDAAAERVITGAYDRLVKLWTVERPLEAEEIGTHKAPIADKDKVVTSAAFSPDGKRAVTSGYDGRAIVWDLDGRHGRIVLEHDMPSVHEALFSESGEEVVTASGESGAGPGSVAIWRLDDPRKARRTWRFPSQAHAVACLGKTGKILAGLKNGDIVLCDPASTRDTELFGQHPSELVAVSVSSDGTLVASVAGAPNEGVWLWDAATGDRLDTFPLPSGYTVLTDLAFVGSERILVGTAEGVILVLDIRNE